MKAFIDHMKHGFLEYIYEDERDGKGCIFSNSGNNNFLILMGDPQYDIVDEEGYCISKVDLLPMELPHHHWELYSRQEAHAESGN